MKQIQKKNTQKNPVSKAISKKRRTREELANLTKEQRSLIYDRKSDRYKERQQEKQKEAIRKEFPFRKDISFYLNIKVAHRNISPNVILNNIQASENLELAQGMARKFETVPSGELLAQRRVFAPKYLKGYTETPPNVHKERKIHKGERVSSWASPDDFLPEPQRNSNGLDYDNALTLAEWHDLVDSLGIFNALEFLESGLVSATGLELWEYEEGAVS